MEGNGGGVCHKDSEAMEKIQTKKQVQENENCSA
jgi:hypothetical protein